MTRQEFVVPAEIKGERLDRWLCGVTGLTRNAVQNLCESGHVTIKSKPLAKNYKLRIGDMVEVCIPDPVPMDTQAEEIPLDILYEDEHLLIVNKAKGMVVHPAAGNYSGTLVNALLSHCEGSLSGINGVIRPGIVHRIDKDTSGLLIVAKTDYAHLRLAKQIKEHSFKRQYEAVVYGNVKQEKGTVSAPIGRHPVQRKKMCVTEQNSKSATTHYEVLGRYNGFTHLRLTLETGRTHQIRVHMAYLGHPLAGDTVYGPKKAITSLEGQCLHARTIGFIHPVSNEYIEFTSPLPQYFINFLNILSKN